MLRFAGKAVWAFTLIAALFTLPQLSGPASAMEDKTRDITPYWSEGIATLLTMYCGDPGCAAELSEDDQTYIFDLANINIPAQKLGITSAAIVQFGKIQARIDKDGLKNFNGFPQSIKINISDITLNEAGIKEIVTKLFKNNPFIQSLASREFAKEKLSLDVSIYRTDGNYTIDFTLQFLSQDMIEGSISFIAPDPVLSYLVKANVSAELLENMGHKLYRGAMLKDSIAWNKIRKLPIDQASLKLTEVKLLDKIFGPLLFMKKSAGEKQLWVDVKELATPIASVLAQSSQIDADQSDLMGMVDFFSNWRTKSGNLEFAINSGDTIAVVADLLNNGFNSKHDDFCAAKVVFYPAPVLAFGIYMPYSPELKRFVLDDNIRKLITSEKSLARMFANEKSNLITSMLSGLDCATGTITVAYEAGK